MSLEKEVQNIKGRSFAGSSTADGKLYHDLPFPGLDHHQRHRGNTLARMKQIARIIKPKNKTILDIGCSVGGISLGLAQRKATKVIGIDYDNQSIDVARAAAKHLKLDNVEFINGEITIEWVKSLEKVDVIVWLSQWMWIVKQHGMKYAKDLLFEVSKKCDMLIFESAANDGMARIVGATQEDIKHWVEECTIFDIIADYGSNSGWLGGRRVFVCVRPWLIIDGTKRATTSIVERINRKYIKKIYRPKYNWVKDRELRAYKMLKEYDHYPNILEVGDNYLIMDYVGRHRRIDHSLYKDDAREILKELEENGIEHRDIKHANIMELSNKIYLIDFGWVLFSNEDPKKVLSNPSLPYERGLSDEDRMTKIFNL